ncbi:MAG TPA: patatin-like phospholipase family protein, partial [Longimicrobiales bacterium]
MTPYPKLSSAAFAFLAGLSVQPLVAQQAQPEQPMVLAVSGGVSRGAYQAGVNWALIETFRRTRDDAVFLKRTGMPRMTLAVSTGASAGNVNTVLSAIEACQPARAAQDPESSLFWRIWIPTGIEQLFPIRRRDASTDSALFHRKFYTLRHYRLLDERLSSGPFVDDCATAIGIALTSLTPQQVSLGRYVKPVTQRVVTTYVAASARGAMHFNIARALIEPEHADTGAAVRDGRHLTNTSLGKVIALEARPDGRIERPSIYEVTEASSAFPVAFSPRTLRYYDPAVLSPVGGCPLDGHDCAVPESSIFLDGGVFDNNPVHLAMALYQRLQSPIGDIGAAAPLRKRLQQPGISSPHVIFIDPDEVRGRLRTADRGADPASGAFGLVAAGRFVGGFVPSAMQYELQMLARMLPSQMQDQLRTTSRSFPIFGNYLEAFGAFFGRPLREYDFYAGVYDGLRYLAWTYPCDRAEPEREQCTAERLAGWLADSTLFNIPAEARPLLQSLFNAEFGTRLQLPVQYHTTARGHVFERLFLANQKLHHGFDNRQCARLTTLRRMICTDGFGQTIGEMAADAAFMRTIQSWAADGACELADFADTLAVKRVENCRAERSFVALLRDPGQYLSTSGELALHQLWRTENLLDIDGDPEFEPSIELAQFVFASTQGRFRKGLNLDPSTIIDTDAWWLEIPHVLPNWASVGLANGSMEAGWRPSLFVSRSLELTVPLGYYSIRPIGNPLVPSRVPRVHYGFAGVGATWLRDAFIFSAFQASAQRFHAFSDAGDAEHRSPVAAEVSALVLAEKVRIGYRRTFRDDTPLLGSGRWAVTLGMSD